MKRQILSFVGVTLGLASASHASYHDPNLSGIRILNRRKDTVYNVSVHLSRLFPKAGAHAPSDREVDTAIRLRLRILVDGKQLKPAGVTVINDWKNDQVTWQTVVPGHYQSVNVLKCLFPEDRNSSTLVSVLKDGVVEREWILESKRG